MTSPKRLIEDGTTFDRRLLRASRAERPSTNFEDRVIAAAGLASPTRAVTSTPSWLVSRLPFVVLFAIGIVPIVVVSVTGAGSKHGEIAMQPTLAPRAVERRAVTQGVSASNPENESASERSRDSSVETPNVIAVDELPNQVLVAGGITTPNREPPPIETSGVRPAPRMPTMPVAANTAHAAETIPTATSVAAPSVIAVETKPRAQAEHLPATEGAASLHREVELLDGVKQHLRSGAASAAERGLGAYDAEFPRGTLKPEAGLLRVRVLLAKGDRDGARRLGDELLCQHPNGVFEKRIRTALGSADGETAPSQASPR